MTDDVVQELTWAQVSVPLDRPLQSGGLVIEARAYVCVRAVLGDGAEGQAFVLTRGLDVAAAVENLVAPRVLGHPYDGAERRLRVALRNIGWDGPISRAASVVSLACLDARARGAGLPVWRLLSDERPAPSEAIAVIGYTPVGETPDEVAEAERAAADGALWVKLMGGFAPPETDIARVRAVRNALGDRCRVALDVNGAWPADVALDLLPRLAGDVAFVEEPWAYELGLATFDRLAGRARPGLAFGEVSASTIELAALAATGQVDHLRPDATLVGGPQTFCDLLGQVSGPSVMPHFWPEVHRHLVAPYRGSTFLEYAPAGSGGFGLERFVDGLATPIDGRLPVPDGPGFGYRLDWREIAGLADTPPTTMKESG